MTSHLAWLAAYALAQLALGAWIAMHLTRDGTLDEQVARWRDHTAPFPYSWEDDHARLGAALAARFVHEAAVAAGLPPDPTATIVTCDATRRAFRAHALLTLRHLATLGFVENTHRRAPTPAGVAVYERGRDGRSSWVTWLVCPSCVLNPGTVRHERGEVVWCLHAGAHRAGLVEGPEESCR